MVLVYSYVYHIIDGGSDGDNIKGKDGENYITAVLGLVKEKG
jgi:hypothetical protein